MSILSSFSSWARSLSQRPAYQSFFYKLGESFGFNIISDAKAIELAHSSGAWYSISNTIAKGVSSLPIKLAVVKSDGTLEEVKEGDEYDFIFKPNQDQTLSELWNLNTLYEVDNGESYEYLEREAVGFLDGERVSLPPQSMEVNTVKDSIISKVKNYTFSDYTTSQTIEVEDVLHVKYENPTLEGRKNRNGLSPIQAGYNLIKASINIETALAWYFENRGSSNIISSGSNDPSVTLTTTDQESIESSLQSKHGGAHRMNKLAFSSRPVSVTQLNASSSDMQMIDNYNNTIERLCALVDLPPVLIQVNTNSTYNNVKEAKTQAYNECYIPRAERKIRGYERTWLKELSRRTGKTYKMYVDRNEIDALNPTPLELREQNRLDVEKGILAPNEAREAMGKEPKTGGDELKNNTNAKIKN